MLLSPHKSGSMLKTYIQRSCKKQKTHTGQKNRETYKNDIVKDVKAMEAMGWHLPQGLFSSPSPRVCMKGSYVLYAFRANGTEKEKLIVRNLNWMESNQGTLSPQRYWGKETQAFPCISFLCEILHCGFLLAKWNQKLEEGKLLGTFPWTSTFEWADQGRKGGIRLKTNG